MSDLFIHEFRRRDRYDGRFRQGLLLVGALGIGLALAVVVAATPVLLKNVLGTTNNQEVTVEF